MAIGAAALAGWGSAANGSERPAGGPVRRLRSPDNSAGFAPAGAPCHAWEHSALACDTPKMPGEPPRVQPSKKVEEHWDADGNWIGPP
jgi:hypothetical protein